MRRGKAKRNYKSVSKKNRLKADFSTEIGTNRKCDFCKSYMKYSKVCALGNKPSSKFICYKFEIKAGLENQYKEFLLGLKLTK